jgi:hypothetical protein
MECNLAANRKLCACTYEPCSHKGKCCECVRFHKGLGELPGCVFTREQEAAHDRSIGFFVRTHR